MGWLLFFGVLCLICMAAMVPMLLFGGGSWRTGFRSHHWSDADDAEDARAILDRRYASGELTPERYQAMRADLGETGLGFVSVATPGADPRDGGKELSG